MARAGAPQNREVVSLHQHDPFNLCSAKGGKALILPVLARAVIHGTSLRLLSGIMCFARYLSTCFKRACRRLQN